jgi:hypothetical protein
MGEASAGGATTHYQHMRVVSRGHVAVPPASSRAPILGRRRRLNIGESPPTARGTPFAACGSLRMHDQPEVEVAALETFRTDSDADRVDVAVGLTEDEAGRRLAEAGAPALRRTRGHCSWGSSSPTRRLSHPGGRARRVSTACDRSSRPKPWLDESLLSGESEPSATIGGAISLLLALVGSRATAQCGER